MLDILRSYFRQELIESWFFCGAGAAAIACGVWLITSGSSFKGAAWPLIGVAIVQIAVGLSVGLRTPEQARVLEGLLSTSPVDYKAEETPRMETVMKSFRVIKIIEIVLACAGLALTFLMRERQFWFAVGIGLLAQAGLSLILDLLAEHRGAIYLNAVKDFLP